MKNQKNYRTQDNNKSFNQIKSMRNDCNRLADENFSLFRSQDELYMCGAERSWQEKEQNKIHSHCSYSPKKDASIYRCRITLPI